MLGVVRQDSDGCLKQYLFWCAHTSDCPLLDGPKTPTTQKRLPTSLGWKTAVFESTESTERACKYAAKRSTKA